MHNFLIKKKLVLFIDPYSNILLYNTFLTKQLYLFLKKD